MSGRKIWVPKKVQQQQRNRQAPPLSTSAQSSWQNPDLCGETRRACNDNYDDDDSFVGITGELMTSSGKIAAHGRISNNEFDGRSASNHRPVYDNRKFMPSHKGNLELMNQTLVETECSGCPKSFHRDIPLEDNTRFDPQGKSLNINMTEGFALGEAGNADKGRAKVGTSEKVVNSEKSFQEKTNFNGQTKDSVFPYDICPPRSGLGVKLKPPLLSKNRELRRDNSRNSDGFSISVLRQGMLLLKKYISLKDQVKVTRKCRDLGLGPGGFYLPGYEDGAKLKLKMMCLGKNWGPETCTYGDRRPCDDAKPPLVPEEFRDLVKTAIKECHSHLVNHCGKRNVENILPYMTPDICIVNFYTQTGRLGLHKDKDESQESLRRGLPVVSFSIGDSAEFLYGDERNVDKVDKINLESGDVLIFGGEARHIYHGVSTIFPDTAPKYLLDETNLRSGRLNLTFREY